MKEKGSGVELRVLVATVVATDAQAISSAAFYGRHEASSVHIKCECRRNH